jgi:hypothetical protein
LDAEGVPLGGKGKISMEEFADAKEKSDEERNAELIRRILRQLRPRIGDPDNLRKTNV